jgi:hypothetical protein
MPIQDAINDVNNAKRQLTAASPDVLDDPLQPWPAPAAPTLPPDPDLFTTGTGRPAGGLSRAWYDLIVRADGVVTEVGDLAPKAVDERLAPAFWAQDLEAFKLVIERLEGFVKVLRRARQARPYLQHPNYQAKMAEAFDVPGSLEGPAARDEFLRFANLAWREYWRMAGPIIKREHPDLV